MQISFYYILLFYILVFNLIWLYVIVYAQTVFLKYLNYSELSINFSFYKSTKYEEAQCCFVLSA